MRPLLLLFSLLAAPAVAQISGITLTVPTATDNVLEYGAGDCGVAVQGTWAYTGATPCSTLELWLTESTCTDSRGTSDFLVASASSANIISGTANTAFTFAVSSLPAFSGADAGVCGSIEVERTFRLCASVKVQNQFTLACDTYARTIDEVEINYDSLPPPAPTITQVSGLDSALSVRVEGTGAEFFEVLFAPEGSEDFTLGGQATTGSPTVRVSNLENGISYVLRAYALDGAGNRSTGYDEATGTPLQSIGIGEDYIDHGGGELGGCQAVGGSAFLLVGLAAGAFALRRRRS